MPVPAIAYAMLITAAQPVEPAPAPTATQAPQAAAPAAAAAPASVPASRPEADVPAMQDIIVVAPPQPTPADPFAHTNVQVFKFVRAMDGAVVEPAAMTFKKTVPTPLREGVRNVFDNLDEPLIAANFLLQLHPGKAVETLARFAINSTIGWAGLFDVAKQPYINLPRRPNGFADTLGYYGVKPGAYIYLPFIGPSNARDLFGGAVDLAAAPLRWVGGPFKTLYWQVPTNAFTALETRVEFQQHLLDFRASERGVYISEREWYRRLREARIAAHKAGDHGAPVEDVESVAATPAK